MAEKLDMKQLLTDLEGMDFKTLNEEELVALTYELLEHLGDTDSDFRDGLIYPTLAKIVDSDALPEEQCRHLLGTCLGDRHLFYNLGEKGDSVFMRSFSALVVMTLVRRDAKKSFLSEEDYAKVFAKSIEYIEGELDTRGHVEGKGWAHAVAHGTDMLLAVVRHPIFKTDYFKAVLGALENCLFKEAGYADSEDKRFVLVLKAMQDKGLDDRALEKWINGVFSKLDERFEAEGFSYRYYRAMNNVENFMKSMYFRFKSDGDRIRLRVMLFDNIKELPYNKAYYFEGS